VAVDDLAKLAAIYRKVLMAYFAPGA
jgi:hypothetical protein